VCSDGGAAGLDRGDGCMTARARDVYESYYTLEEIRDFIRKERLRVTDFRPVQRRDLFIPIRNKGIAVWEFGRDNPGSIHGPRIIVERL